MYNEINLKMCLLTNIKMYTPRYTYMYMYTICRYNTTTNKHTCTYTCI